ncbi:uncharacterized protein EI90DRAFT_907312, partial [Cantharellus anzutake]|uniref:uncharacterized protein n=1 Tax=Cantharellus anzutake TaxID=1750568 RepID=UPI001906F8A6
PARNYILTVATQRYTNCLPNVGPRYRSVERVILCVISMLAGLNLESSVDIDCCKLYPENKREYKRQVRKMDMK